MRALFYCWDTYNMTTSLRLNVCTGMWLITVSRWKTIIFGWHAKKDINIMASLLEHGTVVKHRERQKNNYNVFIWVMNLIWVHVEITVARVI